MALPFKSLEHKTYPRTFLTKVLVGISYDIDESVLNDGSLQDRLRSFLRENFNLDMGQINLAEKSVKVENDGKKVAYLFSRDSAAFVVNGTSYESFHDTVFPYISALNIFSRDVIGAKSITSQMIRKMNVFSLEDVSESGNAELAETKNQILSHEFLKSESAPLDAGSAKVGVEKMLSWKDQEITVSVRYLHREPVERKIQHLLDLEVVREPAIPISLIDVESEESWNQVNQILFNALHWCVSDSVIKLMSNTNEQI